MFAVISEESGMEHEAEGGCSEAALITLKYLMSLHKIPHICILALDNFL